MTVVYILELDTLYQEIDSLQKFRVSLIQFLEVRTRIYGAQNYIVYKHICGIEI